MLIQDVVVGVAHVVAGGCSDHQALHVDAAMKSAGPKIWSHPGEAVGIALTLIRPRAFSICLDADLADW